MNFANMQDRKARERLLFGDKVRGQSAWRIPGGDKRVRGGVLSREFIGT